MKLARGDRRGLGFFDTSIDGVWRSFRAALICYPFYLVMLAFRIDAALWQSAGVVTIVAVETIAYVISWVGFPLLILPLTRFLDREERFLAFIVVYNWCQLPQTALFFVIAADGALGLLPPAAAQSLELAAAVAVLIYDWYIARVTLAISGLAALPIILIDLLLGTVLSRVSEGLY